MDKIAALKKTVSFVVGVGVSKIVRDIIENNVDVEHIHQQVAVPVASFAIGGAVAKASSEYTDGFIDEAVKTWNDFKNRKNVTE